MTLRKANDRRSAPPPPAFDKPTETDLWYLACLRQYCAAKEPPSILVFSLWIKRTATPTHRALRRLEAFGLVERNESGRFMPKAGA